MEIGKTSWQTIAEENKLSGGLTFGYEAPASTVLLKKLQEKGIWVEVRNEKTTSKRLIQPNNTDRQVFSNDQRFCIMSENRTFPVFEKFLTEEYGATLPEDRFDEFVDWTNPKIWHKTGRNEQRGYFLSLDNLSDNKKWELRENLRHGLMPGAVKMKDGKLLVSDPECVSGLEFVWKTATAQNMMRPDGHEAVSSDKNEKSVKKSLANSAKEQVKMQFTLGRKKTEKQGV